jgi:hypothetical protein
MFRIIMYDAEFKNMATVRSPLQKTVAEELDPKLKG